MLPSIICYILLLLHTDCYPLTRLFPASFSFHMINRTHDFEECTKTILIAIFRARVNLVADDVQHEPIMIEHQGGKAQQLGTVLGSSMIFSQSVIRLRPGYASNQVVLQ